MRKALMKIIMSVCLCAGLSLSSLVSANAVVQLPDGAVQGLPSQVVVLDDQGQSVTENGEYFVEVDNMEPYIVYRKDIAVMNLSENAAFNIYMSAKPLSNEGNVDLQEHTICRLYLDGKMFYEGKIYGIGNIDMQNEAVSLGDSYKPGDIRHLTAEFIWDNEDDDISGTYYGRTLFIWQFYCMGDDEYCPPQTGIISNYYFYGTIFAVVILALIILTGYVLYRTKKLQKRRAQLSVAMGIDTDISSSTDKE